MTNAQSKMIKQRIFPLVMLFDNNTKTELRSCEEMSAFIDMTENTISYSAFNNQGENSGEELRVDKEFYNILKDKLVEDIGILVDRMMKSDSIQNFPLSHRSKEEIKHHSRILAFGEEVGLMNDGRVFDGFLGFLDCMIRKLRQPKNDDDDDDWGLGGLINNELELLRITGRELNVNGVKLESECHIVLSITTPKEHKRVFGESQMRVCDNCEKRQSPEMEKMEKCGGCNSVRYCNRDCQKEHWKSHKSNCKRLQPLYQKAMETQKENKEIIMDEC